MRSTLLIVVLVHTPHFSFNRRILVKTVGRSKYGSLIPGDFLKNAMRDSA